MPRTVPLALRPPPCSADAALLVSLLSTPPCSPPCLLTRSPAAALLAAVPAGRRLPGAGQRAVPLASLATVAAAEQSRRKAARRIVILNNNNENEHSSRSSSRGRSSSSSSSSNYPRHSLSAGCAASAAGTRDLDPRLYHYIIIGWRFAAALLPRLFGKNPRSHHKGATGRVRTGNQRLPVL